MEEHKLDGIISMPSGVFKPYAGVSTAILLFTKTSSGGTDDVWFYDMQADGYSLDDKRNPLPNAEGNNDLPDIRMRWKQRNTAEKTRFRTEQSFCVSKQEIVDKGYDLSINRYQEVVHEAVEYEAPSKILEKLKILEDEIIKGFIDLEGMLK